MQTYNVAVTDPVARAYVDAMLADEHMRAWEHGAKEETSLIEKYDAATLEAGGLPRAP